MAEKQPPPAKSGVLRSCPQFSFSSRGRRSRNTPSSLLFRPVLFLILDTYYLALECAFRESYNEFVGKLKGGGAPPADLYQVAPSGSVPRYFAASLKSFSIWPFYPTLVVMILIVWCVLGR